MKKIIIVFILMIISYMCIGNILAKSTIIPEDAIRIRIIANSNSSYDQEIKNKVKENIEYDIYNMLKDSSSISESKEILLNNIDKIDFKVRDTLNKENYTLGYEINYGMNYFPEKTYKGVTYEEGEYESLVITLGEGLGDNWWCVLFPPLCALEAESSDDVEYTTLVNEVLSRY